MRVVGSPGKQRLKGLLISAHQHFLEAHHEHHQVNPNTPPTSCWWIGMYLLGQRCVSPSVGKHHFLEDSCYRTGLDTPGCQSGLQQQWRILPTSLLFARCVAVRLSHTNSRRLSNMHSKKGGTELADAIILLRLRPQRLVVKPTFQRLK